MSKRILVGLDDSPASKAALRWAAQYARQTSMCIRAVHALSWPFGVPTEPGSEPKRGWSLAEIDEIYRESITAAFDEIHPRPDWILQFAKGDAGPVLARQSSYANLLVIGMPDQGRLGRMLVGSVGQYCLSHASCPVVAVPASYAGDEPQALAASPRFANGARP